MDRIKIAEVSGGECLAKLKELRAQYPTTGLYPFLIGSADEREWFESADRVPDEQVAEAIRAGEAMDGEKLLRTRREEYDTLMQEFGLDDDSLDDEFWESVADEIDELDREVAGADGDGESPDEDDEEDADREEEDDFEDDAAWDDEDDDSTPIPTGPASGPVLHRNTFTGEVHPIVLIGLARIDRPWHLPAILPFGGWNECPAAAEHVAAMKYWHERFGAEITGMSHETIECAVARPPADPGAAMELAREQEAYCCDIVLQGSGTVEELAEELENSTYWYFWWD